MNEAENIFGLATTSRCIADRYKVAHKILNFNFNFKKWKT